MKNNSGFTLIEMLIAMVVTLVIIGGAYSFFTTQQRQTTIQTNVSDTQQTLRTVMDYMSRDIRMAGYDPEITGNFGIDEIRFRDLGNNFAVNGNSYIRFSWDIHEDGLVEEDLDADGTINRNEVEIMEYSLVDGATITPGTPDLYLRFPGGSNQRDVLGTNIIVLGLAYAIDTNSDGALDQDAANSNTTWFIDAGNDNDWDSLTVNQGAGTNTIVDTGIPVNTQDIRSVRIWMLAQSQAPDPNYTDNNTYVVGPHILTPNDQFRHRMLERTVLCRNMGLNL